MFPSKKGAKESRRQQRASMAKMMSEETTIIEPETQSSGRILDDGERRLGALPATKRSICSLRSTRRSAATNVALSIAKRREQ